MSVQRTVLLITLFVAHCLTALPFATAAKQSPSILFVLADDMGWKDAGYLGSDLYETPCLDQLVRDGMRFSSSYAACHVCSPTRASIMTGKYPARLHLTDYIAGGRDRKLTIWP